MKLTMNKNQNPEQLGSPEPIPEGRYHAIIQDIDVGKTSKNGGMYDKLTLLILDGEKPAQKDKKVYVNLMYKKNEDGTQIEGDAHLKWAWACKLIHPGDTKELDIMDFGGCQVIVQMIENEYNGRKSTQVGNFGYDVWPIDHPDVANVPRSAFASENAEPVI